MSADDDTVGMPKKQSADHVGHHARAYQQEMFLHAMKRNTIVVMDTGSGKTQVAIMCIRAELERCPANKRVWFLAPGVELCKQQHQVLTEALPSYSTLLLVGSDNVDHWSEKAIWDAALDQRRIIVSTHAILRDALSHAFLSISDFCLLVYDEAHHCGKGHPGNSIMQDFYHPTKLERGSAAVPRILGLSASLVMQSNLKSMANIEHNLDAISRTPRIHCEELLRHVHRPVVSKLTYSATPILSPDSHSLGVAYLDKLCKERGVMTGAQQLLLGTAPMPSMGYTDRSLAALARKASVMLASLGPWAADFYLTETVKLLVKFADHDSSALLNFDDDVHAELLQLLKPDVFIELCAITPLPIGARVSAKVEALIQYLVRSNTDTISGIVFVEQRVTTTVLAELLNRHPATAGILRSRPFVGASNHAKRKHGIAELVDFKAQKDALSSFRDGECSLMIATNALEEGIDVQACNVVVCFDLPNNLKSFIQRRGRARHQTSKLGMLVSDHDDRDTTKRWEALEQELLRICQEDRDQLMALEEIEADDEENMDYQLFSKVTGAHLTAEQTLTRLHHFCNLLPHRPFVEMQPTFTYAVDSDNDEDASESANATSHKMVSATCTLPVCVTAKLRCTSSARTWKSQRNARRDAAFHAYQKLYNAGLINENLLPISHDWVTNIEKDAAEVERMETVSSSWTVWSDLDSDLKTCAWRPTECQIETSDPDHCIRFQIWAQVAMPSLPPLTLHWSSQHSYQAAFSQMCDSEKIASMEIGKLQDATWALHTAARPGIPRETQSSALLFSPDTSSLCLQTWLQTHSHIGQAGATGQLRSGQHIVKIAPYFQLPYIFRGRDLLNDVLDCEPFPRRRDFRLPIVSGRLSPDQIAAASGSQLEHFAAGSCRVEPFTVNETSIGLFMPAIAGHIEDCAVAHQVMTNILHDVPAINMSHILTALTAPSAVRLTNYQQLEFYGNCLLKFVISCHLFATYPDWHEGFLTRKKEQLVSNTSLAATCLRNGLDQFIITDPQQIRKWRLPQIATDTTSRPTRLMSSKTLADVVEALIGAAWLGGSGIAGAVACINVFLPFIPADPDIVKISIVTPALSANLSTIYHQAQSLIEHTFDQPVLLLEALTHPSVNASATATDSYQRLEFLGDAVLDMLIMRRFAGNDVVLSQRRMTILRHALASADLLGYFCLNLRAKSSLRTVVPTLDPSNPSIGEIQRETSLATFMAFDSQDVARALQQTEARYLRIREDLSTALANHDKHPWLALLELRPEKFVSDVVEAILGAIYVDTHGDLEACLAFLTRLGWTSYMERLLAEEMDVLHPKERLQLLYARRPERWTVSYVESRDESGGFACDVVVNEQIVGSTTGCGSRAEAVTRAATVALERLAEQAGDVVMTGDGAGPVGDLDEEVREELGGRSDADADDETT